MSEKGGRAEVQADLSLTLAHDGSAGSGVEEGHRHTGQGAAHGTGLERRAGRFADRGRHLGLAVAVAQRQPPRRLDLRDDLGVERLTGADDLAQAARAAGEVGVDEHPPHGRRRTEARHVVVAQLGEERSGVEALVVEQEDRRLGDPRREEAGPRVLGPAGAGDVEVDVAGAQAEPVHRRQVPDGVAHLGVLHQLGPAGRAGGEVEQQRVAGGGARVRRRRHVDPVCRVHVFPSGRGSHADPGEVAVDAVELPGLVGRGDDMLGTAAGDAVLEVAGPGRRRRRHDHGAELHDGEHEVPELDLVAEHEDDRIALADPLGGEPSGDAIGAGGEGVESELTARAVVLDDDQGGAVIAPGDGVEPVDGPVEAVTDVGEGELGNGALVVLAQSDELVPRGAEGFEGRGGRGRRVEGAHPQA
jgi:hypothetical protein